MPKHSESRHLPYTAEQLYNIVADIKSYPEFLPWCVGAAIRERQPQEDGQLERVVADLWIGYKLFRERFTSLVQLTPHSRVDVAYSEGPFKYLNNHWVFTPHESGGCIVDFDVNFEFKSSLLQHLIEAFFTEAVHRMVQAFESRARSLYGASTTACS